MLAMFHCAPYLRLLSLAALLALVVAGCKEETADPVDLGQAYTPYQMGSWYVYNVDSIDHNAFTGTIDTFQFQLREVYESTFTDNSGRETFRIERYKRATPADNWALTDVYSGNVTATTFERFEENQRFLLLSFPPESGKRWDGNAFNNLGEQEYEYDDVDANATINGQSFSETLTVVQENNINLIEIRVREEQYARDVGLVRKQITSLDLQENGGIEYTQEIDSWGVE